MSPQRNDGLLERPLNARSVIGSLLLGVHPPRLPGARIVEWCTRFGIAEGTTRVALSRMVERSELTSAGGVYELAGRVRDLQGAQDWSLRPRLGRWTGAWRFGIVGSATSGSGDDAPRAGARGVGGRTAQERAALRDAMRRLRYAEAREGVWTRPDNLPAAAAPLESWAVVDAQCSWWSARPEAEPQRLAADLFAPAAWAARASALLDRVVTVTDQLSAGDDDALAPGFVVGAAALQHARRDPLLPVELLPADWPGDDLRSAYVRFQKGFAASLAAAFRR